MKKILAIDLNGFCFNELTNKLIDENIMPVFNDILKRYSLCRLEIPYNNSNSRNNHIVMGSGKDLVSYNDLTETFLKTGYKNNELFVNLLRHCNSRIHLFGIISDDENESNIADIKNAYKILVDNHFNQIFVHLIITASSAEVLIQLKELESIIETNKTGKISTIIGEKYALNDTEDYNKTKIYYDLLTMGIGIKSHDIINGITNQIDKNNVDIKPLFVDNDFLVKDKDILFWLNKDSLKTYQIVSAFCSDDFNYFSTMPYNELTIYRLIATNDKLRANDFIKDNKEVYSLGMYLSDLGFNQARVADSLNIHQEIAYFDNTNDEISDCDYYEVISEKIYEGKKKETSLFDISKRIVKCMEEDYDFIYANYDISNMDDNNSNDSMLDTLIFIDKCIKVLKKSADDNFYKIILFSSFNKEKLQGLFTILDEKVKLLSEGRVSMIAPTILNYMEIALPQSMQETPDLIRK